MAMKNDGKTWRGIELPVQNWHEEFDKFLPKHLQISKICILVGHLWPKYVILELKEA